MAKGTPPMGKEKTDSSKPILDTGKGHMVGPQHAGRQVSLDSPAGTTAGGAQNAGGGFGKGGPQTGGGHMVSGQQHAGPQTPGQTAAGGLSKGGGWGVSGGTTKMFGKQQASPAKPV